jgi:DNA topoisomerase-2
MTRIEVDIGDEGTIRVMNDGRSIPVAIHKDHKVYIAELIFGHLLTSSNYEDDIKKIVGGRNGYGAKLANIFSKKFEVKTGDGTSRKQLTISWTNNMSEMKGPEIGSYSGTDFTTVSFLPDYKRFGLKGLTTDMASLLKRRVYDMAGILKVKVLLNGKEIKTKSFNQYVNMYLG